MIEGTADFEGFVSIEFLQKVCCVEISSHSFYSAILRFCYENNRPKSSQKSHIWRMFEYKVTCQDNDISLSFLLSYV